MNRPKLGDLLREANLIDEVQEQIALEEQKRRGTKFGSTLIALHFIEENVLAAFLAKQLDVPCVCLTNIEISPKVQSKISRESAHHYGVVPVRMDGDKLFVAMTDPMDMDAIEELEKSANMVIVPMIAPQSAIEQVLSRYYDPESQPDAPSPEGESSPFPELNREINEIDLMGRYFNQICDRLERIEAKISSLERRLDSR